MGLFSGYLGAVSLFFKLETPLALSKKNAKLNTVASALEFPHSLAVSIQLLNLFYSIVAIESTYIRYPSNEFTYNRQ